MKLLIIGAGSFSTEVEELAKLLKYDEIAFVDDNPSKAVSFPVVGGIVDLEKLRSEYDNAIVALGRNSDRLKIHEMLEQYSYSIPALIHPTAYISPEAIIEPGCIVRAMSVIGRYAKLEKATILNIGAKVDHHCIIGKGSHLQINSAVRGSVKVEELTWLDSGKVIEL